ncbi:MAG: tyrosine-type recombinase/integrase [Elusimicrobiota bacterium]|nr:tyrosine-type recombinase/integrase [Elusimicrobiota bacterium]
MSIPLKKTSLEWLKTSYLHHLRLRNLSPLTIKQVDLGLRIFIEFAAGRGIDNALDVDLELCEQYKTWLGYYKTRRGQTLTVGVVVERLNQMKGWFEWMRRRGYLTVDRTRGLKVPMKAKRLPRGIMTYKEVHGVMALPDLNTPLGYRDRTIMEVLYASGIRAKEITGLRLQDVDLEKLALKVTEGKGGKQRFAMISTPCANFLRRYMEEIRPQLTVCQRPAGNRWKEKANTGGDLLFLSLYGGPLSRMWLAMTLKRYIKQAGISRAISPVHSWRHSAATHLVESGMDIRFVQAFLGHEKIDSTEIYTHVERKSLHKFLKQHHPRELANEPFQPFTTR